MKDDHVRFLCGCFCRITMGVVLLGIGFRVGAVEAPDEQVSRWDVSAIRMKIECGPFFTIDSDRQMVMPWFRSDSGHDVEYLWYRSKSGLRADSDVLGFRYLCDSNRSYGEQISLGIPIADLQAGDVRCDFFVGHTTEGGKGAVAARSLTGLTLKRIPNHCESGKYTFAFGSCSHQERFGEHQPIWNAIVKDAPDCFFFIGDNIYLPSDSGAFPETRDAVLNFYRERYNQQRMMPELQPLLRSTYCFGIWDDHDYGPNNADKTWQWKGAALEAFKAYFPGSYGLPGTPGCFQKFSWGDVDVFLLDDRTYRDPNNSTNPDKTMFGEAQLAWLKQGLAASNAGVKLVFNGNQMLSDRHPHESWGTYYRAERDAFLRWLWDARIGGVFFLSGDRHFAELIHKRDPKGIGSDVWELTSSPLANSHFAHGGMVKNRERIAKYTKGVNYGVIRVDSTNARPMVDLIVKDVSGNVVIEQRVRAGQ